MKLQITLISFLLFSSVVINAQTEFGIKGGVNITFFKVSEANFGDNPDAEAGYYAGVFMDFKIRNEIGVHPELLYIGINDFRFLNVPINLKYDISDSFNILVGPSLNYFFDFFSNKFKVRADLGLAYELSSNLGVHTKYTIGFEELSPNIIFFGTSYKL